MSNTDLIPVEPAVPADPTPPRLDAGPSVAGPSIKVGRLIRDLIALTKPRITALVLLTGGAGMWLAPGSVSARTRWLALLGTALVVSSANALNMWWERDVDAKMARTRTRPLPAGRMPADLALGFGVALGAVSLPLLFAVNALTGVLGLVALVTYVAIYTPLKRHSWLALLVGAVPGAMPPLMGWTTVSGRLDLGGLLLFAVLFLWQVPHFGAIALFRRDDYARAGLQVLSVQRGESGAKRAIVTYTVLLVFATLLLFPFRVAGAASLAVAASLGAVFVVLAARGSKAKTPVANHRWARTVFAYSIVYLMALLVTLLFDRPVS